MKYWPTESLKEVKAFRLHLVFPSLRRGPKTISHPEIQTWRRHPRRALTIDFLPADGGFGVWRTAPPSRLVAWAGPAVTAVCLLPNPAFAHVKWFASTSVAEAPLALAEISDPLFWSAAAMAFVALFLVSLFEQTSLGQRLVAGTNAAAARLGPADPILRVATGSFFLSLWAHSGILLTPELPTDAALISWLQLGISACMLNRRLLPLGAFGILALYGEGARQHGLFHMLDYVFFLGLGWYLALSASCRETVLAARMPVLRLCLALSLMWVGVEKLVYPQWTLAVMAQHPIITFGFDPQAMTRLAGIVEFSLAFSLLCTPLIRRAGALVLAALMAVAILEFGKVDAIGHIVPIGVLIAIAIDRSPHAAFGTLPFRSLRPALSPVLFGGAWGMVFASYSIAQAVL